MRSTKALFYVGMLLTIHSLLLAWQAYRYSPTADEPAHLASGISHWNFGRFDLYCVNPPLVRMVAALPMLIVEPKVDWAPFTHSPYSRPEFTIGRSLINKNGFEIFWYFTLARWTCIPFSLIGGYFCYCWGRDLYGTRAGLMALVLWCFCPNILGNGALITPDVPSAALGMMACYVFWRWLREPGWGRALAAGGALGLAELTKSTWIILFGLWPALWLVWAFCRVGCAVDANGRRHGTKRIVIAYEVPGTRCESDLRFWTRLSLIIRTYGSRTSRSSMSQLASILMLGLYLLNLGYGFENSFQRLDAFTFISKTFGGRDAHNIPGNRFAGSWLGSAPIPIPANFLRGIDIQKFDFERRKWSYLRGEQKLGGWWYYYLYAMAVKMPLGTLVLFGIRCVAAFGWRFWENENDASQSKAERVEGSIAVSSLSRRASIICNVVTLLMPSVAVLLLISCQTGFSRYFRYAIPVFPFIFIWVGQLASTCVPFSTRTTERSASRNWLAGTTVVILVLGSCLSSIAVFPHCLSYFNAIAGGPVNGGAHLVDANVDWGQDRMALELAQLIQAMWVLYWARGLVM